MRLSCVLENGRLLIREADPSHSEPEYIVYYWPTRFGRRDLHNWAGGEHDPSEVQVDKSGSTYSVKFPGCGFWCDTGIHGKTQAVRVDREPIPRPKVRRGIETRFYNGCWQKYLKREGWVPV